MYCLTAELCTPQIPAGFKGWALRKGKGEVEEGSKGGKDSVPPSNMEGGIEG